MACRPLIFIQVPHRHTSTHTYLMLPINLMTYLAVIVSQDKQTLVFNRFLLDVDCYMCIWFLNDPCLILYFVYFQTWTTERIHLRWTWPMAMAQHCLCQYGFFANVGSLPMWILLGVMTFLQQFAVRFYSEEGPTLVPSLVEDFIFLGMSCWACLWISCTVRGALSILRYDSL